MIGVLVFDVDEVRGHHLEPLGEETRERERQARLGVEHRVRVLDDGDDRPFAHDDIGSRRHAEQQRHLADAGARLSDDGDRHADLLDSQLALEQHEQRTEGFAVDDEHVARLERPTRVTLRE